MGFETKDTILLILAVNVTAAIGAFGFGYAQDRIGKVRALRVTLVGWIVMVAVAYFGTTQAVFWIAANLAGLAWARAVRGARAGGLLLAAGRSAEFFGLWGVATRLASILGPVTYGAVTWATGGNTASRSCSRGLSSGRPAGPRLRGREARPPGGASKRRLSACRGKPGAIIRRPTGCSAVW